MVDPSCALPAREASQSAANRLPAILVPSLAGAPVDAADFASSVQEAIECRSLAGPATAILQTAEPGVKRPVCTDGVRRGHHSVPSLHPPPQPALLAGTPSRISTRQLPFAFCRGTVAQKAMRAKPPADRRCRRRPWLLHSHRGPWRGERAGRPSRSSATGTLCRSWAGSLPTTRQRRREADTLLPHSPQYLPRPSRT